MMLLITTPVSGLLPTTQVDTMIHAPIAQIAQLRPYMRSGITVKPRASTATAMPITRLCVTSAGWLAVKWSTHGETAQ